jgi:hypothetical protein
MLIQEELRKKNKVFSGMLAHELVVYVKTSEQETDIILEVILHKNHLIW